MSERAFRRLARGFVEFLTELEANNDRDWFKANRARYDALLRDPMTALGEDLAKLGRPHLFRPYNDTRFHPGPPIKEHQGLAIGMGGAGGYYVEISLDGLLIAAGLYAPESDQVERMRAAVADGRRGGALKRALATAPRRGSSSASQTSSACRAATTPSTRAPTCCATGGWSSTSACPSPSG